MPEGTTPSPSPKVKTLAIRLDLELHTQLVVIAQLRGSTITDEIRQALAAHVATQSANADLAAGASDLLDELERETDARREALSSLLGPKDQAPASPAEPAKTGRRTSGRGAGKTSASATG